MSTTQEILIHDSGVRTMTRSVNPWFIAATVTIAAFMELLDTSIANVALPYIGGGLGRSYDEVTWILTTYLVANAIVLPMTAWLSRLMGRKNYYLLCVLLFSVSSLFCGLAPSLGFMLLFRILQGIGGGGLAPVAQAILVDTFPPAKRAAAFALYTIVIVTAPAVGPVLGGWITDNYDWRWIFFINVPIGIVAMWLSNRLIHDPEDFTRERKQAKAEGKMTIDGTGIALITLASAALEIALDRGQIDDWFGSTFITTAIFVAVFGWIATVVWEGRNPNPIIDFQLLTNRNFAIASILFFIFGVGLFGTTTLIPQMLQSLYGYRAIDAGLVLGPGALVITVLAPISAQLLQRRMVTPKALVVASFVIVAIAMFVYSDMTLDVDSSHYAWIRALQGLGYGLFLVPVNVIAYSQLRPDENNKASSLTNLFRNWGGSFGIAFITTASDRRQNLHQSTLGSNLSAASQSIQQGAHALASQLAQHGFTSADAGPAALGLVYERLLHESLFLAFMDCFRVLGWLNLLALPLVFAIRKFKPQGDAPIGH
ncbi:DHA2 family efflux MFS transporter permease subunit [Occallatibacter riparius]|uniref:DHA2 family efflux MFS transporter permease subunit n=1 Tax=Occallatibacter riparius TaxID=1002689 RepID=A0A9J7BV83_9BACT|nr:DHA2 family efflux MFS transporter permease subunit [Occallatibacter riparius]UWZ86787.1 DHA2 family efflux MFS transporter permease subunit [Occallatibacter riparius]